MRGCCTVPLTAALIMLVSSSAAFAIPQAGDQAGEAQPALPEAWMVHDAPVLTSEESLARLVVPEGFRVECVASEPLLEAPIDAAFAPDGALWVLEMPGYMTDMEGSRELEPLGRLSTLRDTNGDGRMDARTVFANNLILPRAFAFHGDGVLIVEPPHLHFMRDTNGDGQADESTVLCSGFAGLDSPEHAGNGMRWMNDGTYSFSQHPWSLSLDTPVDGGAPQARLVSTPAHGQWGLGVDDAGRLYYSPNSDALLCDIVPKEFAARHASGYAVPGVPRRVVTDQRVWPIHLTPGVNRAYRKDFLRDGALREFTAACGPTIYRDELLGADLSGDAFVCEPSGNLVMRFNLQESDEGPTGAPADGERAFLASTDERFRPVQALSGPDGALYVVDMARGVIQHKKFVTSFLRKQVEDRRLLDGLAAGRVWRVVREDTPLRATPDLTHATPSELVALLRSPSGATRDMAQRLLVERGVGDEATISLVRALHTDDQAATRRVSLWTLVLLGAATDDDLAAALADHSPMVRTAGVLAANRLGREALALPLLADGDRGVRRHAAAVAGTVLRAATPAALEAVLTTTRPVWEDATARALLVQSLDGREAEALPIVGAAASAPGSTELLGDVMESALLSGDEVRVRDALEAALALRSTAPDATRAAMLRAVKVLRAESMRESDRRRVRCAAQPMSWTAAARDTTGLDAPLRLVGRCLIWPGRAGYEIVAAPPTIMERGARLYAHCAGCHGPEGNGLQGVYPPLRGSPFVTGDASRLAAILLKGMGGRLEVNGAIYNGEMPPAPIEGDADLAALMTYIRGSWTNMAEPVSADDVKAARSRFRSHAAQWTADTLREALASP